MERLEKKVDAWQRKCKALREKGQKQIDYNKKLMMEFETNKRERERLKRMSNNLAGEVAEATRFDRSSVTVSPTQKRLNSVFDSIENEYARELRKKTRSDLVYNNSILKKKNDSLTKLLLNAKEGLRELLREREKHVAEEWRQKKSLESVKKEVKCSKKQKQDMEQDFERKQEQIEATLKASKLQCMAIMKRLVKAHAIGWCESLEHNAKDWLDQFDGKYVKRKWKPWVMEIAKGWRRENIYFCETVFAKVDRYKKDHGKRTKISTVAGVVESANRKDLFGSILTLPQRRAVVQYVSRSRKRLLDANRLLEKRQAETLRARQAEKDSKLEQIVDKKIRQAASLYHLPCVATVEELDNEFLKIDELVKSEGYKLKKRKGKKDESERMKLDAEGYKESLLETQIDIYCNSYGYKELSNTLRGKSKADNKVSFLYEKFKNFLLRKKPTKPQSPKPSVDPTLQALEKDEGGVMSAVYAKAVQGMVEKLSPNVLGDLERLYQKYSPKLDYRMIHDAGPIEFPEDLPEIAEKLYPGVKFDYTDELEAQSSKKRKTQQVKIEC